MKINTIITTLVILLILGFASFSFLFSNPELVTKKESFECKGREYLFVRTLNGLVKLESNNIEISKINASVDNFSFTLSVNKNDINDTVSDIMNCAKEKYTIVISEENPIQSEESKYITCYFSDPYNQKKISNCNF
jgi:hypothetical protein